MGLNARYYWTREDLETLARLAAERVSTRRIAARLGRTEKSVRNKASALQIALSAHGTKRVLKRLDQRGKVPAGSRYSSGTVRVTVDFDISALTREERFALAARLLDESADGKQPVELPPPYDAVAAARARYAARVAAKVASESFGKPKTRRKLSREELHARRTAARMEGLRRRQEELRFRDRVQRMREAEYVRDMMK